MKRKILQIIGFSAVTALFTAGCDGCGGGGNGGVVNPTAKTYTVSYDVNGAFDANGDEVKIPTSQTVEEGGEITLDSIGGDEYPFIFKFWTEERTDTAGKKSSHPAGQSYKVTKDITLYAQWDSAYIVVFNANGASGTVPSPQKQVSGGSITLPDEGGLIMDDYIFNGWDTHKSGSANTYGAEEDYSVDRNDTLYAQWAARIIDVGEMVEVTGGTFTMGESGEEKNVDDFSIGKYEVTQKLWRDVMGKNPSKLFKGDSLPVTNVSWDDIQEFLAALNEKDPGKNYRLPTEAEWEYAARGGDNGGNYDYSGSNTASDVAVYNASKPANIGSKNANDLDLYDMSGNVWEWVEDESDIDPNESGSRIIRGGGWDEKRAEDCSVSRRQSWGQSGGSKDDLGFRLASD